MKVGIAGAGAVGAHYGVRLQKAGLDVVMLARGEHLQMMQANGLRYESEGTSEVIPVNVTGQASDLSGCDVIVLSCKTTQLSSLLCELKPYVGVHAVLVTMQNGVTAPQEVADCFLDHRVVAASAFIGARLEEPGWLIHSAAGHLRLGQWQGESRSVAEVMVAAWQASGVDAQIVDDMQVMLWNKMAWNCGFNAITALSRCYARDVALDDQGKRLVEAAMCEMLVVAKAEGVVIDESVIQKHIELTTRAGEVKTSMWQDVMHGRKTEIEAMNGYVCKMGRKQGISTPVNYMLATLIHLAETHGK